MVSQFIAPVISTAIYGTAAYFITQSKTCDCPSANSVARSYILGFSYVGIAWAVLSLILGSSAVKLLFDYPLLGLIPVVYAIGLLAWAILVIQHSYTLKACQCPQTVAGNITFGVAVIDLIIGGLAILALGFEGTKFAMMSAKDRNQLVSFAKAIFSGSK